MSKTVPDGLKARECKQIKLREPPPVPYVLVKDEVQDEVVRMLNMEIKTKIEKDTTLNFSVWQENETREAFLMHVTAVLDAIKKRGHFEDYDKAAFKFREACCEAIASAKAGLSLLGESEKKANKVKKKQKEKPKEGEKTKEGEIVTPKVPAKVSAKEGLAKAPEPKAAAQEAEVAPAADDQMKASFVSDLE
jgi:hypothetical protein